MAYFYTLLANLPACSSFMRRAGSHQNWKTWGRIQRLEVYEAHLGYIIEDVHPNGGIKKIKSSVYSNFPVYNFLSSKIHFDWFPNPVVLKVMSHTQQGEMSLFANRFRRLREAGRGHLSRLQGIWSSCSDQVAVELNTHSCCMCGRTHSCCKVADSVGTSPEPTTKKPVRCNNLE
ncbi:hypothetical protein F2Q68_00009144 [Brassica cretica]|uniref:Uncharacterized protein n=1 Tax=Brassica cretica TaxID=69181 RepID=A0A8S9KMC3_BRACR|nr:hypothetical protein F2Q68_00009144 [Brassica cretica]